MNCPIGSQGLTWADVYFCIGALVGLAIVYAVWRVALFPIEKKPEVKP